MKRVLVDTNVILDLLAAREPFQAESRQLFSLADLGHIELVVSSLSLVNTHFILSERLKKKEARSIISRLKVLVTTIDLSGKIIDLALNDDHFEDFEDGIQYYTALGSVSHAIVTRNQKDFKKSELPVLSPGEYLRLWKTSWSRD
jgi:predicted nucleic acid-binding protein